MTQSPKNLLAILLIAPLTAYVVVVFGGYAPVAATEKHSPVVAWTLNTAMRNTVRREARGIVPPDLHEPALLKAGAGDYDAMCAGCHAAPGKEADDELVRGLNPSPPELAKIVDDRTPAELFWVTKFGIRMTGMPAWGPTHRESHLWALVAFMKALPKMSAADYRQLLASAPATAATVAPEPVHDHAHHHGAEHEHDHHTHAHD